MGLFDFFKKGEEKPAPKQTTTRPTTAQQPTKPSTAPTSDSVFDKPGGAVKAPVSAGQMDVKEELYTIKSGDTLSKIAKVKYGDAQQWRKIHEANKDQIKNPDKIFPGQTIKIPR